MAAVEVVRRVQGGAGLVGGVEAGVQVPVVAAVDVDQGAAVDVDGRQCGEATGGVLDDAEVDVIQPDLVEGLGGVGG